MRLSSVLIALFCCCGIQGQGLPPRAAPSDYQTQAQAGTVTVAAEFTGHVVSTPDGGPLSTEEYVVVEIGLFGAPDARLKVSLEDFSLRINGKKAPSPAQPYELVLKSLKDPELEPTAAEKKSKTTGISTGGNNAADAPPPVVYHAPIGVQRAMALRVKNASLLEGERALPQAGLIFFAYRGKAPSIHSLELVYAGAGGKAVLDLHP
jgi:hypothetical protein